MITEADMDDTTPAVFDEKHYTLSPENIQVARDMADALAAWDQEKIDELATKMVLPLSMLKALGKDFVKKTGLPTVTAELAHDTDWLK